MSIKAKILENLKKAVLQKSQTEILVLRGLLAVLNNREIEKKEKLRKIGKMNEEEIVKEGQLVDEEIVEVIFSEIKKRKEAILLYEKGNRRELADKEKKEMEILKKYLPEQITEDDLARIIEETIRSFEKTGQFDKRKGMGMVIKEVMKKAKGRVQGELVSRMVKEFLKI